MLSNKIINIKELQKIIINLKKKKNCRSLSWSIRLTSYRTYKTF